MVKQVALEADTSGVNREGSPSSIGYTPPAKGPTDSTPRQGENDDPRRPGGTYGVEDAKTPSGNYRTGDAVPEASAPAVNTEAPAVNTEAQVENPYDKAVSGYQQQSQQLLDALKEQTGADLTEYRNSTGEATSGYDQKAADIIRNLGGLTDQQLANYAATTGQSIDAAKGQIDKILADLQGGLPQGAAGRVGRVDTVAQENLLRQIVDAQKQQSQNSIDYAVQQGVNQLTRAQEDAEPQYQTMRNQIASDEAKALDNQALYSEARADRGGIGAAQYAAIQNNAATNQLTVNREQTKLATDTARQIADLRAQGEFQKANQLLSITQSYLSQLMQLKQWADSTNVSVDEFNIGVEKWEQEYNAQIQQALAGMKINAAQYGTGLDLDRQSALLGQSLAAAQQQANLGLGAAQNVADMEFNRQSTMLGQSLAAAQNQANLGLGVTQNATSLQMQSAQDAASRNANAAEQMIKSGITPTNDQLSALGWTREQYDAYKTAIEAAKKVTSGKGGGSSLTDQLRDLVDAGIKMDDIQHVMLAGVASGKYSDADNAELYVQQLREDQYQGWNKIPE